MKIASTNATPSWFDLDLTFAAFRYWYFFDSEITFAVKPQRLHRAGRCVWSFFWQLLLLPSH